MDAVRRTLASIAGWAALAAPAAGHDLVYVEPGNAACPAPPAAAATAGPAKVARGTPVAARLRVDCGFERGSYTVTLGSTDPGAVFAPRSFLVNFGRLAGSGAFTVSFSTPGLHGVSAAVTANMGSPAVPGHFAAAAGGFEVVPP